MKPAALLQMGFIAVAASAVYAFVAMARDSETRRACVPICAMRPTYAGRNRTAPDFVLPDADGNQVHLSQFRGKTVILNFWTTTCQPCLEEMPSLADFAKVVAKRDDVVVLTISTDLTKDVALSALHTLLGEPKPPFSVLFDPESTVVHDKFGTDLYPETWVIDPKGVIRARFDGARDWSNALVLDLIESFTRPATCSLEFQSGKPVGSEGSVCEDSG
ncbi:MAG TPA: TlpA disulfide reductase family protein [Polyangiaceae bacterium]|jgi:peroxiredoxin|nr:TlpA disulfide reductase family protein [Polyangiaceae bacterium]